MRNSCLRLLTLLVLLLPGPLAAAQDKEPEKYSGRYDIRFMDLHDAEVLAWDQCAEQESCRVQTLAIKGESGRRGVLEVSADPRTHEKIVRALAKEDAAPRTLRFQLLLLAASTKPGTSGPGVPANAQKAMSDLKGFLPYQSYQLLDTAWFLGTQDRRTEARLVGRNGAGYEVMLWFENLGSGKERSLHVHQFLLRTQPVSVTPVPPPEDKETPRFSRTTLIDTSFGLKEGETIVVGTSKVNGAEEALVLLLTAVPPA